MFDPVSALVSGVVTGGLDLLGASQSADAQESAAQTTADANTAAAQLQYQEWLQQQANMQPWLTAGTSAINTLSSDLSSGGKLRVFPPFPLTPLRSRTTRTISLSSSNLLTQRTRKTRRRATTGREQRLRPSQPLAQGLRANMRTSITTKPSTRTTQTSTPSIPCPTTCSREWRERARRQPTAS